MIYLPKTQCLPFPSFHAFQSLQTICSFQTDPKCLEKIMTLQVLLSSVLFISWILFILAPTTLHLKAKLVPLLCICSYPYQFTSDTDCTLFTWTVISMCSGALINHLYVFMVEWFVWYILHASVLIEWIGEWINNWMNVSCTISTNYPGWGLNLNSSLLWTHFLLLTARFTTT